MNRPAVFTIPPGSSFLDTLAAGLLSRGRDDPLAIAATTVLLPTRRAGRALTAAFLRVSGGAPMVLPRILPLGDLDEDALSIEDEPAGALDLPPAMSSLRRQLLLSRLILQLGKSTGKGPFAPDQAARLAAELGRLLDQVQIQQLSFDGLAALVPAEFAAHWQITLEFLELLTAGWPSILAAQGEMGAAARRNAILTAQEEAWRAAPPQTPVIAAGSTGSIPATASLLSVIAQLPRGEVVLPGLDLLLEDEAWQQLEESHPQYAMARLLERTGLTRGEVRLWSQPREAAASRDGRGTARQRLVSEVMRPAATTEAWRYPDPRMQQALEGLTRIDCPGLEEEARVVALLMREAAEEGRTAALVTPDRGLARRVTAEMARWHVTLDDSAGRPLSETATGVFLRLITEMLGGDCEPVALLACLKHPFAAGGISLAAFREQVRRLERDLLRGPRPEPGLAALRQILVRRSEAAGEDEEDQETRGSIEALLELVAALERAAEPFAALLRAPEAGLAELLAAHVRFAEELATTMVAEAGTGQDRRVPGASRLWAREEGEAAARFVSDLIEAAPSFGSISGRDYPALFESLLAGAVARPRWGAHPQLAILGTIEARLLHVDHVILGGLNEGTWPPEPAADPWMSRPMRAGFGLPAPEYRIGLSAHDFAQALCGPRVTLTRAARVEGTPTVPSRWLLRLDSVRRSAGLDGNIGDPEKWLAWAEALDRPEQTRAVEPPFPRPPVVARPRELAVGEVETWLRDPYSIYAKHILKLAPLPPLDADPGAAERGRIIHEALERFSHACPGTLPGDALDQLVAIGREAFGDSLERPGVLAFWWPRFERIARWVLDQERRCRPEMRGLLTRMGGRLSIAGPEGPFTVAGRVDRIELREDGAVALVDYRTGSCPEVQDVTRGASPAMAILTAMALDGGIRGVRATRVERVDYWRLSASRSEVRGAAGQQTDPTALATAARDGLTRYVAEFDDAETPYLAQPRPTLPVKYSDYDHLARVKEWARSR